MKTYLGATIVLYVLCKKRSHFKVGRMVQWCV